MNTQTTTPDIKLGDRSPWDEVLAVITLRPGMQHVYTIENHGLYLSPELNQQVPAALRIEDGWYQWLTGEVTQAIWAFQDELYDYLGGDHLYARSQKSIDVSPAIGDASGGREWFQQHLRDVLIDSLGPGEAREWMRNQPVSPIVTTGNEAPAPILGYTWSQDQPQAQAILDAANIGNPGKELHHVLESQDQERARALIEHIMLLNRAATKAEFQWEAVVASTSAPNTPTLKNVRGELLSVVKEAEQYSAVRTWRDPSSSDLRDVSQKLLAIAAPTGKRMETNLFESLSYLGSLSWDWEPGAAIAAPRRLPTPAPTVVTMTDTNQPGLSM